MPSPTLHVDILDPFATLTFAAAQTTTLRIGTGICLVPKRNPLTTAKEDATLDKLLGGRFDFGVANEWLEEEFCSFPGVRSYPKPTQTPHPSIISGGDLALKRVGEVGDGWFGMNVSVTDAKPKIHEIKDYAKAAVRDPGAHQFSISPGIGTSVPRDDLRRFQDAGVHQIIIGAFPADLQPVKDDIDKPAEEIVAPAAPL